MPKYMKAYLLSDLRRFSGWHEARWPEWVEAHREDPEPPKETLEDDDVVYLQEDWTVTRDVFGDGDVIFDDVTPEWKDFCRDTLEFQIPDWDAESERVRRELQDVLKKEQPASGSDAG